MLAEIASLDDVYIVQAVSAKKGLIVHFVNSHGAFAQVFKMLRERHVPRPQMISSIVILAQIFKNLDF